MSDPRSADRPAAADALRRRPFRLWGNFRRSLRSFGHALERGVKHLLFSVLSALMRLGSPSSPPDWRAQPRRVLLLRYDKIGDMVLATGLIRAIVLAQPTVTVDVLASAANAAVLEGNPHVSHVFTVNKTQASSFLPALWRIRSRRYDAVLDPMFPRASLTNMLLMWLSGARYRIGIAGRGNDYALTLPVAPLKDAVHHIDQTAALLGAFGASLQNIKPQAPTLPPLPSCTPATGWGIWPSQIYLTASERHAGDASWGGPPGAAVRLLVNISVSSPERRWPEECFIAALQQLTSRFPRVVPLIVASPADAPRMERIAQATGAQRAHTAAYRQMMAIVAACDLALTGDTAVTHIACAFGKPVLALFHGNGGAVFGPYTGGYGLATSAATLESLAVKPVVQALEALILQAEPGSLSA